MHPLEVSPNANLTVTFSLRLVGALNPTLHPFFEHLNPGFKLYIGDTLMFNYLLSGEIDNVRCPETFVPKKVLISETTHFFRSGTITT